MSVSSAAALSVAGVCAENSGRQLSGNARDLDDAANELDQTWRGRSGSHARDAITRDRDALHQLSGVLLFVAEALRVEGRRLGEVLATAENTADSPQDNAAADTDLAVAIADGALAARLYRVCDALLVGNPGAPAAIDSAALRRAMAASPQQLAQWWHQLGPHQRQWLIDNHSELLTAEGVPAATRDVINRQRLHDLVDAGVRPADFQALTRHLEGHPDRMLLSLEADGRAVVSDGNPDRARQVLVFVPGTGSSVATIDRTADRATTVCTAAQNSADDHERSTQEPGCVGIAWQGYDAPDDVMAAGLSADPAREHADDLADFTAGLDAVDRLDGHNSALTTLGYSYGSTALGFAAATEQGIATDRMVHVGSPGAGVDNIDEQRIDDGVSIRTPETDEVVGVRSRWDPVPWYALMPALGAQPGSEDFGGLTVTVDTGSTWSERFGEHSRYFDDGTPSLQTIGDLVAEPGR